MVKLKKCVFTAGTFLLLVPAFVMGITAEAYGITNDGGLNIQQIKNENSKVNSIVNETIKKINDDNQKINQKVQQAEEKAAEFSKENKINTNIITNEAVSVQQRNSNIEVSVNQNIKNAAVQVKKQSDNNSITVKTGVSKPVNVNVNVSPVINATGPVTKVNVKGNQISILVPVVKINSIVINKPKAISIINILPSVIPVPIVIFKPVVVILPNLFGNSVQAQKSIASDSSAALTPSDRTAVMNEEAFAGLPQTGSIIDFYVLIAIGCLSILIGMAMLIGIRKKNC